MTQILFCNNWLVKNFGQFSDGQKSRLVLLNLLYKIETTNSVMLLDEPGDGVGDDLVKTQFEMIIEYAKKRNVMLVIATHRINLIEDLVTKRYHIENGVLSQVPIIEKTSDKEVVS